MSRPRGKNAPSPEGAAQVMRVRRAVAASSSATKGRSSVVSAADCRGLAPLDEAAEPRRVELEDMGNDLQVVGRERGLDVAVGRDVGHAEVDLARLGTRALDQRDLGMVGPPRPRAGEQVLSPLGRGVTPAPRMFEFVLIADGIATVGFVRAGNVVRSFVLLGGQPASL